MTASLSALIPWQPRMLPPIDLRTPSRQQKRRWNSRPPTVKQTWLRRSEVTSNSTRITTLPRLQAQRTPPLLEELDFLPQLLPIARRRLRRQIRSKLVPQPLYRGELPVFADMLEEIGRASCRERV